MTVDQECENIKKDIKAIFKLSIYGLTGETKKFGEIVAR
jgi:hypothetical protein